MVIIIDNGLDSSSEKLETICYALGIHIRISTTKTPCRKETIERLYKLINEKSIDGITLSDIAAIDSEGDIKWE